MGGMNSSRSTAAPLVASVIVGCLLATTYAAGYFCLGTANYCEPAKERTRQYDSELSAAIYKPAGWIEQACAGYDVVIMGPSRR